jgi:hypothetical protein
MSRLSLLIALALVVALVVGYLVMKPSRSPTANVIGQPVVAQPVVSQPVVAVTPPWRCASLVSGGWSNIVRRVDGALECATSNGRDCFWYNNLAACDTAFPGVAKDSGAPLNCAGSHIPLHGDGRASPSHWCYSQRSDV